LIHVPKMITHLYYLIQSLKLITQVHTRLGHGGQQEQEKTMTCYGIHEHHDSSRHFFNVDLFLYQEIHVNTHDYSVS
jgi:hypothetical protein